MRDDIAALKLRGTQRSIAEIIYALARDLDSGDTSSPAQVGRQIAQLLADLERSAEGEEVSAVDAIQHSIADELAPRRRAVAPPGA